MRVLIGKLRTSRYVANVAWLVRGNVSAHVIQLAALPVISRLFTPAEFGQLTVFVAFTGFAVIALTWRLESALLIARERELQPLIRLSFLLLVVMAVFFAVLLWVLRMYQILGHEILPASSIALVLLVLLGLGSFNIGRVICLRSGEARRLASARIWRTAANMMAKLVSGYMGIGASGLLFGEVLGAWLGSGRVGLSKLVKMATCSISVGRLFAVMHRYRRFVRLELPSNLIDQLAIGLPVPMLAAIGGASAAGAYGIARMVVAIPNAQVGNAVADAFQLRAGELVRERQAERIRGLMSRTVKALFLLGLLPYGAIALFSPWLFSLVFGEEWEIAGVMASLISIWLFSALVVGSVSRLLSVIQRQELKLFYDVAVLLAVIGAYGFAIHAGWGPVQFIAAIVAVNVAAYLGYLLVLFKAAPKAASTAKSTYSAE